MTRSKSILGADFTATLANLADAHNPRPPRAERPLPGVAPMMAVAGRDLELNDLDRRLEEAHQTISRLEQELSDAKAGGATTEQVEALTRDLDQAREAFAGALPTRRLDPKDVRHSRFQNRHPDSYRDAEYLQLREEIRAAGGNTQPIGVRPLLDEPGKYELSFGSRRLRACLENGLPVLALVDEMDDRMLFERMERENRQRKNLRPYEQGVLYLQALDAGLYPSTRQLADALQVDSGGLTRLLAVARLPQAVVDAFPSPLDIQAKWGPLLAGALAANEAAVLAAAAEFGAAATKPSAQHVFERLWSCGSQTAPKTGGQAQVEMTGLDGQVVTITFRKNAASVSIRNLAPEKRSALEKALRKYLG